jgi:hypothetical protein
MLWDQRLNHVHHETHPWICSRNQHCWSSSVQQKHYILPTVNGPDYVGIGEYDQGENQWKYWYGRSLADYTWANPVQESPWETKGYSTGWASTFCKASRNETNIFEANITKDILFGTWCRWCLICATTRIHGWLLSRNDVVHLLSRHFLCSISGGSRLSCSTEN